MTNTQRSADQALDLSRAAGLGAGLLIALGLSLQWFEVLCARFVEQNSWFFPTLFGGAWNMISLWLAGTPWHEDVRYWPLLLVAAGAGILFSRGRRQTRRSATAPEERGARRDA